MKTNSINPMRTIEDFREKEIKQLNDLLNAYIYAGRFYKGKYYANLPATWYCDKVYPDFNSNSGLVFLANSDYQTLVLTEYGVAEWYFTSNAGYEGTLFDLAEKVIQDLTDKDNNPLPINRTNWDSEDLNQVYGWLNLCISDFHGTGVNTTSLYKAKELIAKAFILSKIELEATSFKQQNINWEELLEPVDNWYETFTGNSLLNNCLSELDQECDENELEIYGEFIRKEILKFLEN